MLKIAKFIAYIVNESGGDFKQGNCLYEPTSGIQYSYNQALVNIWQASEKANQQHFGSVVVVISYFIKGAIDF